MRTRRYLLMVGSHSVGKQIFHAGDVVESTQNLSLIFQNKFRVVNSPEPTTIAPPVAMLEPEKEYRARRPRAPRGPHLVLLANAFGRGRGGGELATLAHLEAARGAGWRVSVFYAQEAGPIPIWIRAQQARADSMATALSELHARDPVAVVLCNNDSVVWAQSVATKVGVPVVCYIQFWQPMLVTKTAFLTMLDMWLEQSKAKKKKRSPMPVSALDPDRSALVNCQAVVANSSYTADVLRMTTGRKADSVAHPYVDPIQVLEGPHNAILCPSGQMLKGADVFLELAKRHPDRKFLMLAGDVSGTPTCEAVAAKLGNVEVIRDWTHDMSGIYARTAVLFVGTRTCESYCRTAAEARSLGIPVLLLAAGNLVNHVDCIKTTQTGHPFIAGRNGALVNRSDSKSDAAWDAALDYCLGLVGKLKPDASAIEDQRGNLLNVLTDCRQFPDVGVAQPPYAPGVSAATRHLVDVLGVRPLPWKVDLAGLKNLSAVIVPGQWWPELVGLPGHKVVWWCSHSAQMDTSRHEAEALAKVWGSVTKQSQCWVAFTSDTEADVWASAGKPSLHLPVLLAWKPRTVAKRDGLNLFLPGPYGPRKNVMTALGAASLVKADVHVTKRAEDAQGFWAMAESLGVHVHAHNCPTVDDVAEVAGSCQAAVAISMAETFHYAAAECVMAGTPTVWWPGIPALIGGPTELLVQDPGNTTAIAEAIRLAAGQEPSVSVSDILGRQQAAVQRVSKKNEMVVRRVLNGLVRGKSSG